MEEKNIFFFQTEKVLSFMKLFGTNANVIFYDSAVFKGGKKQKKLMEKILIYQIS